MSVVTNFILTCDLGEERPGAEDECSPAIAALNAELDLQFNQGGFKLLNDSFGGYKGAEAFVLGFAGNCTSAEIVIDIVASAPWRERKSVRLFVQDQEEDAFRVRFDGSAP